MSDHPVLVFGDDASDAADVAWLWINSHHWTGWNLDVLTAHRPEQFKVRPAEESRSHEWHPEHPRIPFAESGFLVTRQMLAETDPRFALSVDADLVVIGARGRGLLKKLHLGSTAEYLMQRPTAPLAIVREGHPVRSIVLCADGSPHAEFVTATLAGFPWISGVEVSVLAVQDDRVDAQTAVDTAARTLVAAGALATTAVVDGLPTPTILDHIDEQEPDLVALGTQGLTGLSLFRLGSTASAITRAVECSVLLACAPVPD